jgi:hypothetical protein
MGLNLGFNEKDYKLVWAGISGMSSYCVVSLLHSMVNYFGLPYAVLIHCGGNDIGIEPCGKLLFDMKFMFFCNFSNAIDALAINDDPIIQMIFKYPANDLNLI